jgi:hypothetical protein
LTGTRVKLRCKKNFMKDYLDMVKDRRARHGQDPELKKKIWGSPNPAKEAYQHGRKRSQGNGRKERDDESRETPRSRRNRADRRAAASHEEKPRSA